MSGKKNYYSFIALLYEDKDGISIEFPDLPGCCPCSDNLNEAIGTAREALGVHLFGMEQDGDPIPDPSSLAAISKDTDAIPVLIDVFMPPVRDRIRNRYVRKTLSLPAWLASKADESGVNCSKLFQNALMEYLGISS